MQGSLLCPPQSEYESIHLKLIMEKANILLTNYLLYLLFSAPLSLDAASSPVKGKKIKMSLKKTCNLFNVWFVHPCCILCLLTCKVKEWLWGFLSQVRWVDTTSPSKPQRHKVINRLNYFSDLDNDSDTEVPYADIMITVRGVSTPELTQVGYLSTGDGKEVRDKRGTGHMFYIRNI